MERHSQTDSCIGTLTQTFVDDKINNVKEVFAAGATCVNVLVDEEHLARHITCKQGSGISTL